MEKNWKWFPFLFLQWSFVEGKNGETLSYSRRGIRSLCSSWVDHTTTAVASSSPTPKVSTQVSKLLSELKTYFFVESVKRKFKRTAFIKIEVFCDIINVFTVTFDQFNTSLLNKSIDFIEELLNSSVLIVLYVWKLVFVWISVEAGLNVSQDA